MTISELNEIKGRLMIWHSNIGEAIEVLKLAIKSQNAERQTRQVKEAETYESQRNQFIKTQLEKNPSSNKISPFREFELSNKREFPTQGECFQLSCVCLELSVIHFCKILTKGYAVKGKSAKNSTKFIKVHLENIERMSFLHSEHYLQFQKLKEKALTLRDKVLAHTDGDLNPVEHFEGLSVLSRGTSNIWHEIDVEFFKTALESLSQNIMNYKNRIEIAVKIEDNL